MEALSPIIVLIVAVFLIILSILWVILPFAVFGIKKRLDSMNSLLMQHLEATDQIQKNTAKLAGEVEKQLNEN